jgi:hypothetical protein
LSVSCAFFVRRFNLLHPEFSFVLPLFSLSWTRSSLLLLSLPLLPALPDPDVLGLLTALSVGRRDIGDNTWQNAKKFLGWWLCAALPPRPLDDEEGRRSSCCCSWLLSARYGRTTPSGGILQYWAAGHSIRCIIVKALAWQTAPVNFDFQDPCWWNW